MKNKKPTFVLCFVSRSQVKDLHLIKLLRIHFWRQSVPLQIYCLSKEIRKQVCSCLPLNCINANWPYAVAMKRTSDKEIYLSHRNHLFYSFSDFVVYVVTTLIFLKNQRQRVSFSINVAILFLSFKRATAVPNKLIDIQHYKRFHSLSHFTLTTTLLNLSFLKNFQLLQNDSETGTIFSQPPLISFKRDRNIGNFLIRSSFQTSD